jgi:hypothetical protein
MSDYKLDIENHSEVKVQLVGIRDVWQQMMDNIEYQYRKT